MTANNLLEPFKKIRFQAARDPGPGRDIARHGIPLSDGTREDFRASVGPA